MTIVGELNEIPGEFVAEWRIKEFFSLSPETNKFYDSLAFSFAGARWCLRIYPNGRRKSTAENGDINSEGYISLYLHRHSTGPPINMIYSLGLKTLDENVNPERHFTYNFKKIDGCGSHRLITRSKILKRKCELLSSGVLTVICKIKYSKSGDISSNTAAEKCSYCKSTLDANEDLSSHQQKCMDKPIKCPECSDVIALKNWYDHQCQKTGAEGNTAAEKYSYCKSTLDANEDLSSHQQKCMDKPIKCPECSDVIALKNWYDHQCQKTGAEGNTAAEKCSYCKSTLDANEDLSSHQQKCMDKPIKCPECSDVIALKNWYDHQCQKTGAEASEKLSSDFKTLMLSGDHSDVIFKVKREKFRLHRIILATRNPYFDSMFKNNMKEKSSGIVTIKDCEPDTFRSFIHFIYAGKVDELSSKNVCELYEAAYKYQEDLLKDECLHFMTNNLSVDSFCDYFAVALRHNEKELFQKAIELFTSKGKEIACSVKWQAFVQKHPIQANELFIKTLDHYSK